MTAEHTETRQQRIDRELIELLNEPRVALPGVQVLFAFLSTVPFTQRLRSNRYAIASLICLGAALCAAVLSVALYLFSSLVDVVADDIREN